MKRSLAILASALLVASLAFPAAALAAKGGNGSARGKDQAPGQARRADTNPLDENAAVDAGPGNRGNGSAKEKPGQTDAHASEDGTETAKVKDRTRTRNAEESSDTIEPKRTGIANALSRIQANIAKAEAKVAAGTKSHVPTGLLRVADKFLMWLGLTPDTPPVAPGDDPDLPEDSAETSDTPVPDDGSTEPTPTPDPELADPLDS